MKSKTGSAAGASAGAVFVSTPEAVSTAAAVRAEGERGVVPAWLATFSVESSLVVRICSLRVVMVSESNCAVSTGAAAVSAAVDLVIGMLLL